MYIAPQTGGESFGIVLVEGMSAGTTVVASNIGAFQRVLEYGELGALFENGDSSDLDRKSTRLNSSHVAISYAVFCLKKKIVLCGIKRIIRYQSKYLLL